MKIKIYSGLSLSEIELQKRNPEFEFSGPIKRGQLLTDIKSGYHIIGIIDGFFLNHLAVTPSEIIDCIRCGVKIFGASSMGAIRAADLDSIGMIGIGKIYDLIKKDDSFEDDFLGQTFLEEEYFKTSAPFINVYYNLKKMKELNIITQEVFIFSVKSYRNMHYSERSTSKLTNLLKKSKFNKELTSKIFQKLETTENLKHSDAIMLLNAITSYKTTLQAFHRSQSRHKSK